MVESVKTNKGYYIGRYETGIEGGTPVMNASGRKQTGWTGGKAVIKAGAQPYNNISWGISVNDETVGAVEKAKGFASQEGYEGVTSTLIYGIQWDATMQFFDEKYITGECDPDSYVRNSSGKGNYGGSIQNTGIYAEKNIYDMGGNVYEWTMEVHDNASRANRSCRYDRSGADIPASFRGWYIPSTRLDYLGFRIALYLND